MAEAGQFGLELWAPRLRVSTRSSSARPAFRMVAGIEGHGAHQQLVQHDAQRVNVGSGVYGLVQRVGLLGAHVFRCSDELADLREHGVVGPALVHGVGDAEVDDLGRRGVPSTSVHQHVGGLEVAVDDALLVGVLHGFADGQEELQPLAALSRCSSQYSVMGTPSTYSITKYGRPSLGDVPASRTRATWGCSIMASA